MGPYTLYTAPTGMTLVNGRGEILDEYTSIEQALEYVGTDKIEIVSIEAL